MRLGMGKTIQRVTAVIFFAFKHSFSKFTNHDFHHHYRSIERKVLSFCNVGACSCAKSDKGHAVDEASLSSDERRVH